MIFSNGDRNLITSSSLVRTVRWANFEVNMGKVRHEHAIFVETSGKNVSFEGRKRWEDKYTKMAKEILPLIFQACH
jgi:hypothetical protein